MVLFKIMDPEIKQKLEQQDAKLDAIYKSVEKKEVFSDDFWVTIVLFILPLIGLLFIIPSF